jgi:ParB/RepB/Spo0J family partition protein
MSRVASDPRAAVAAPAPQAAPAAPAANGQPTELLHIPLDKIRNNPVALRDAKRTQAEFQEMVDSIRARGVLTAISVVRKPGPDGKEFELVDGLQRFSASQEAGRATIPAQVITATDADILISQVIGNAVRLETQPVEFAKGLMRILGYNPTWTEADLAAKVNKSPAWINRQLGLLKLDDSIKPLVNEGKMPVANAYVLAKLPKEEQMAWVERAQTTDAAAFTAQVTERAKQIKEANRKGQDAGEEKFVATFHLRKKPEIEEEMKNPKAASALISELKLDTAPKSKGEAALSGFLLGLAWVGMTDPKTVVARENKWKEQKKKAADDKIRRDAEKADKKQKEAAENAAKATAAAEEAKKKAAALPAAPAAAK